MTENKRYQLRQEQLDYPIITNFYSDLIDTANNDKVICSFELDVGTEKMVDLLNEQDKEISELKQTIRGVYEILSIDVDVFSDKATEHDINAYVELRELDNKDAYYMAKGTKKAMELLKKVIIE